MHNWEMIPETIVSMQLQLANHGDFSEAIQITIITILSAVLPPSKDLTRSIEQYSPTLEGLRRAFRFPHSTLKLHFARIYLDNWFTRVHEMYRLILCLRGIDNGSPPFGTTERLVIQIGNCPSGVIGLQHVRSRLLSAISNQSWLGQRALFPVVTRKWVAKGDLENGSERVWFIGYDFAEGLPDFAGMVPEENV
jgi:hypothetical protein